jgi:hypothetical protein
MTDTSHIPHLSFEAPETTTNKNIVQHHLPSRDEQKRQTVPLSKVIKNALQDNNKLSIPNSNDDEESSLEEDDDDA